MAKRRKKRKKNPHTKRRAAPRRKRRRASNPSRKRRHTKHRRSNPRRRSHARKRRSNPGRRRHARKHRRRNPMNVYLAVAGAAVVSLVVGAIEVFVPNMVAPKIPAGQPNAGTTDLKTLGYIQTGLSLAGIGGGLFLAKKHPMLAVAIAAPSVAGLFGTMISAAISKALTPAPATTTAAPTTTTTKGLGALNRQLGALLSAQGNPNLSGFASAQGAPRLGMGAVYAESMGAVYAQNMGAVYAQNMGDYGYDGEEEYLGAAVVDSPPWSQGTPFG